MHLTAAIQNIDSLFGGGHRISVEVGGALLELGEVFDGLQRSLGTEQALNVHAPQRGSLNPMPELLRPDIADQMRGAVGVSVRVAVETGDAAVRAFGTAILGLIELLLRERRDQQAEALELLRDSKSR